MNNNTEASYVSLTEFMQICRISAEEVVSLLESGALNFSRLVDGELVVDIASFSQDNLSQMPNLNGSLLSEEHSAMLEEVVANEIVSELDGIIDEAISLAKSWAAKKSE